MNSTATCIMHASPFGQIEPGSVRIIQPGTPIRASAPETKAPLLCRRNGGWLRRAHWDEPVQPGDVIEWHLSATGGGRGSLLQIAIAVAATVITQNPQFLAMALASTAASIAAGFGAGVDAIQNASATYNVAIGGNAARLDQPIPDWYGYNIDEPDFAGQPYVEYDANGDQHYHALMTIGQGYYDIRRVMIGDTDISHFDDVQYKILEPGQAPTLVNPAVVSSSEVSGQDLLTDVTVGGFVVCGALRTASAIGIDIICPALGIADSSGNLGTRTVAWRVDARPVNDFGVPTGAWYQIGSETLSAAQSTPVRRSYKYTLAAPARVEVRITRTDNKVDTNASNYDDMQWSGLRAYLSNAAPLHASATHIEVVAKANEQLNGVSQRRIAVAAVRKLKTWSPGSGWSGTYSASRSIAWALAAKWKAAWGDNLPDERCDLHSLWELDQIWTARQDHFDYVFRESTDSDSADQLIAAAGRAIVFQRNGVRTLMRDQSANPLMAAFTARNIVDGSWAIDYSLATSATDDGLIVRYKDHRSREWMPIECPLPGVTTITKPVYVDLNGIVGATHAAREGKFLAACRRYRRRSAAWKTEADGSIPTAGARVRFAPPLIAWGQSGDVVDWNAGSLTATLSEPPDFSAGGTFYLVLMNDFGEPQGAIECTAGTTANQVVLANAPGFTPSVDGGMRERTRYLFGRATELAGVVRLTSIAPEQVKPGQPPLYQLGGVIDDDRVHTADVALLPSEGQEQDPIDDGTSVAPEAGGAGYTVTLTNRTIDGPALPSGAVALGGVYLGGRAGIELRPNGELATVKTLWTAVPVGPDDPNTYQRDDQIDIVAQQWISDASPPAEVGAGYEARFTVLSGTIYTLETNAPIDSWISLSTLRRWVTDTGQYGPDETITVRVKIRDATTLIVQSTATITLIVRTQGDPGG